MEGFKHIIVDGWNAIHAHPRLEKLLFADRAEEAQEELSQMLAPVHDFQGVRVSIVYDGVGADISIVRKSKILTFSEVYTPSDMTADELIEQLCATAKKPFDLLVITRDNLLRLTASSFGAMSLAPDKFFQWSGETGRAIMHAADANNSRGAREWKKSNPFLKLDELALDIAEIKKSPLVSKRLKKKLLRARKTESGKGLGEVFENSVSGELAEKFAVKTPQNASPCRPKIGGKPATLKSLSELKDVLERRAKAEKSESRKKKRNR